eukprot:CAMPEP_0175124792 /NCGR_PEP_ID=MMETSP0087-20121206/2969_1 /TAXON_ID=136419 /ORGANISM="Unknown Unknown, Strain D1" /LENGTH=693 /DNA_ID=CAMNT_0016406581 /DNA_START=149 /DNA_END=2230 /DNA_ORIENTATION=-
MDKAVEELKRVVAYRIEELAKDAAAPQDAGQLLGVCLSARRNMCIHPTVMRFDNANKVDAMCRNLTASFVREEKASNPSVELCSFYENYQNNMSDARITGIFGLDEMKKLGQDRGWCPYFAARHLINLANVVVFNYQYMLDPKISGLVSSQIEAESIVVFDEAHNIDNICIEALSVRLDRRTVQACSRNVKRLQTEVKEMAEHNAERLQAEYDSLVAGLGHAQDPGSDVVSAVPVLEGDILREAVPGNIRRAKNFLMFLTTVIEYFKTRLDGKSDTREKPATFMLDLQRVTHMRETKALRFSYDRLNSLLRTLQIKDMDQFMPLQLLTNFATLVSTYADGFDVLMEPNDARNSNISDPRLQLCCLDAALAMKPVFDRFSSVVITSGTLSPLSMYPKMLNFQPAVSETFQMSLTRNCICPMFVTKGSDQMPITSSSKQREDVSIISNYGRLVLELTRVVPDGMVCFFTSYEYLEEMVCKWDQQGLVQEILANKLIFIETKDIVETSMALQNFKKACDCGRGAVFLSVARGKVAEGVDFDRHYGRCVVMLGIPYQFTLSKVLRSRLDFLREEHKIQEKDFLSFDALRQASQCVGRVIRSKTDYGLMVFADVRYRQADKRNKLPGWITQFLDTENMNMSTDRAVAVARKFLRTMAQQHNPAEEVGVTMLTNAHIDQLQAKEKAAAAALASQQMTDD